MNIVELSCKLLSAKGTKVKGEACCSFACSMGSDGRAAVVERILGIINEGESLSILQSRSIDPGIRIPPSEEKLNRRVI